jgi:hypothetical protein
MTRYRCYSVNNNAFDLTGVEAEFTFLMIHGKGWIWSSRATGRCGNLNLVG